MVDRELVILRRNVDKLERSNKAFFDIRWSKELTEDLPDPVGPITLI
jgi:hypothetical protein